jgi:hypothetical protein
MRDVIEVGRKMMRARVAAQTAKREGREEDYERAMIEARALGWTLGVDFDLQERPKDLSMLASAAGLTFSDVVTLWRLDREDGQDMFLTLLGEVWWLLEVPPREHADGTRTELWSAFLSNEQYRELCAAVDAERSGAIDDEKRTAALARQITSESAGEL